MWRQEISLWTIGSGTEWHNEKKGSRITILLPFSKLHSFGSASQGQRA